MEAVPTFYAQIYVGLRVQYSTRVIPVMVARAACKRMCDTVGLCVTVTPTEFVYTSGGEPGIIVGLINCPRFPKSQECLRDLAMRLAEELKVVCEQPRVSVMFPDETVMIGEAE